MINPEYDGGYNAAPDGEAEREALERYLERRIIKGREARAPEGPVIPIDELERWVDEGPAARNRPQRSG